MIGRAESFSKKIVDISRRKYVMMKSNSVKMPTIFCASLGILPTKGAHKDNINGKVHTSNHYAKQTVEASFILRSRDLEKYIDTYTASNLLGYSSVTRRVSLIDLSHSSV